MSDSSRAAAASAHADVVVIYCAQRPDTRSSYIGVRVGACVGACVGGNVGNSVGVEELNSAAPVGMKVGNKVRPCVGLSVGLRVGLRAGLRVRLRVGNRLGDRVQSGEYVAPGGSLHRHLSALEHAPVLLPSTFILRRRLS